MKKFYLLIACLIGFSGAFAQVVLGDFEDETTQGFTNWGGAHSVVANPDKGDGNNSDFVLKYVPGGAWQGVNFFKDEGVFAEKPVKLTLDVYITDVAAGDLDNLKIKLDLRDGDSPL